MKWTLANVCPSLFEKHSRLRWNFHSFLILSQEVCKLSDKNRLETVSISQIFDDDEN